MPFHPDDKDSPPARRGGGPPGGSAFLSSRLRRSAEEAKAAAEDHAEETVRDEAFHPIETNSLGFTPFDEADTFDPNPPPTTITARDKSFPGGRVSLPRLADYGEVDSPDVTFVGTAFVRRPGDSSDTDDDSRGAFEEYFTYESLFDQPIADPLQTDASLNGEDPYEVLGVDPEAPWREIVSAHRGLVKTYHPDRLTDASPDELARSEEALRLVNRAYSELRRRGRDLDPDTAADDEA